MMQTRPKGQYTPFIVAAAVLVAVFFFVKLQAVLTPFVIAGVLAYILNPLVEKLRARNVPRAVAAMLVMLMTLLILALLLLITVPMLIGQFGSLGSRLPDLLAWVHKTVMPWLNHTFHLNLEWNSGYMLDWLQQHSTALKDTASKALPSILRQSGNIAGVAANLVLLPFLLYYFLLDWQRWTRGIRAMMPRRILPVYSRISGNMDQVLGEFLRGQITVMLVMGVFYGSGLMLVGLDSGFAIGMVAGLLVFIPYLGAFTGLLLATLAAVLQFDGWTGLLLVWGVFAVGQFLESFFITPKIVGDRIGLSPFWVIFALLAFGQLLGFVGMLLALPLAAITLVLVREGVQAYTRSAYYRMPPQDGNLQEGGGE